LESAGTSCPAALLRLGVPAQRLTGEGEFFGLIEKVEGEDDLFKLNLEGKRLNTILNNYKEEYKKAFVARKVRQKAAKEVVEEYHKKYPDLSNYVENPE